MTSKYPLCKCDECPYSKHRIVPPSIPSSPADVIILGESPGDKEMVLGKPFVGQSGELLNEVIPRDMIAHKTNVLLCKPPTNDKNKSDMAIAASCCKPRLDAEILKAIDGRTTRIIALGDLAMHYFDPDPKAKITQKQGNSISLKYHDIPVTVWYEYHPAYILRNMNLKDMWLAKMSVALGLSNQEVIEYPPVKIVDYVPDVVAGSIVSFDIETSGYWYNPYFQVLMLSMYVDTDDTTYILGFVPLGTPPVKLKLNQLFKRSDVKFVAHNGKYDVQGLRTIGIDAHIDFDTMLDHYLLNEVGGQHGLKVAAKNIFNIDDWQKPMFEKYQVKDELNDFNLVPQNVLAEYCAKDAYITYRLHRHLRPKISAEAQNQASTLLINASGLLVDVERRGMLVDVAQLELADKYIQTYLKLKQVMLARLGGFEEDELADLNPNSPKQIAEILYDYFGLPEQKIYKVPPRSTKDEVLEKLKVYDRSGFVDALQDYRHWAKMKSSYIDTIQAYKDADNIVHPSFNLHRAETGRLSANNPAMQTIPSPKSSDDIAGALIRSCFIPRKGFTFIEPDFSQVEIRVGAGLSLDPFLLGVYNSGGDLHTEVAKKIYHTDTPTKEMRFLAKKFNFGYMYGADARVIANNAHMPYEDVKPAFDEYKSLLHGYEVWKQKQISFALKNGYVTTLFGRKRRFPVINESTYTDIAHAAVNMPVQSTASDILLSAAIEINKLGYNIVNLVHDSILVEVPTNQAEDIANTVVSIMCKTGADVIPTVKWKADYEIKDRWYPIPTLELS